MDINKEAVELLLKTIDDIVSKKLKNLSYDVTKTGIVRKVLAATPKKYMVQIEGADYSVPSVVDKPLTVGDFVLVLFLQGNFNNGFVVGIV